MSFMSDVDLRNAIGLGVFRVDPFVEANIQPASIDFRLDRYFKQIDYSELPTKLHDEFVARPLLGKFFGEYKEAFIDPAVEIPYIDTENDYFDLAPMAGCLASTIERVTLSPRIIGRIEGKSSLGRMFLTAHVTAGFFDPGFDGHCTLELFNANPVSIRLYAGMPICQFSVAYLMNPSSAPYGTVWDSKYQNSDRGPKGSQYHRNFPLSDG